MNGTKPWVCALARKAKQCLARCSTADAATFGRLTGQSDKDVLHVVVAVNGG